MSLYGIAAAAVSGATVVVYLQMIAAQGEDDWTRVWLIAALILVGTGAAALGAAILQGAPRMLALSLASADHLVLGFLGMFSIGLPLLVASGLALAGAVRAAAPGRGGMALAATVAFLPLAATAALLVIATT